MSEPEDVDESEQHEADALALALERGTIEAELPEDALQTAALLRYSVDGGELPTDREEAVLFEVLEAAQRVTQKRAENAARVDAPAAPWWRWLFGLASAAALAALLLFFWGRGAPEPTALPEPGAALIGAGLGRLDPAGGDAEYDALMREYRARVYGALSARYESR